MQSFLNRSAAHIFGQHGTHMDDVWVVLPTRRAVSFFQQELAKQSDKPFLSPHVLAVDDFITQAAGVQLIDSVSLLFELYEVFKGLDEKLEFGKFLNWATVLLSDLDRIDQYLINPSELFSYLTAAKSIERWQLELPTGKAATLETAGTQRYFKLFDNLQAAYEALRERLRAKGLAYRGMAYRLLAEETKALVRDNPTYGKLYFVGFNALSRSEETVIKILVKAQKAEVLWDTDAYYMDSPRQEAGKLLRGYKQEGWSGAWKWEEDYLTGTPKKIQIIGVPNASMQAKVAGHLYAQNGASEQVGETTENKDERTALVLGDETLLLPVLYSLGESVSDLNVTMGLSLRNSLLFTLIDGLFEMQRTMAEFRIKDGSTVRIPKFNHRHVVKVLSHPFIRQYEQVCLPPPPPETPPLLRRVINKITTENLVYLGENQLIELGESSSLFKVLFRRWPVEKPLAVIQHFYELIDLLRDVYAYKQDAIETEYLYLFHNLLRQLETTLEREERKELVDLRSLKQFLYELIRQTSIPFESEGTSALQVMGMLETRALDFDKLIILSVNEGVLPQSRRLNSLIPFDACREVGLPTYQDQESVMAYHFYRLLQRAKEVVLLHVTSPDAYGTSKGEKSRFILQIEHELKKAAGDNLTLEYPVVRFGNSTVEKAVALEELTIPKTANILDTLRAQLAPQLNPGGKVIGGLYPTHLNHYLSCSLRYYFSRVIRIKEDDEVEEQLGADEFGEWVHNTLERLDQEYRMKNRVVEEQTVKEVLREQYQTQFGNRVVDSGMNFLLYRIAEDLMVKFNNQQQEKYSGSLEVLQTEEEWSTVLEVPTSIGTIPVRIAGKIDRVEKLTSPDGSVKLRVADYKTGKVEKTETRINGEEWLTETKYEKVRQLWLYQYLVYKKMLEENGLQFSNGWATGIDTEVVAGFYSFRNLKEDFIENSLKLGHAADYVAITEQHLKQRIAEIFDQTKAFTRTEDKKVCEWCDYRRICGR
ncbi:PD-(D/E)XK nuclease family protein [Tellurirhabdus bombi]|uniref:PD-(D/E)XK nuclease family protein n=1 Tax=Tellurirhabdus bombi TaxID=2907205 RepID=UPI001F3AB823|nr:PD-(D/E)XK nuclease family protein [Tellurirhabdus bombi]